MGGGVGVDVSFWRVITTVYFFTVTPSSAVTIIVRVFLPTLSVALPSIVYLAAESSVTTVNEHFVVL